MKNEEGNRYGRLTVVKFDHSDKRHGAMWLCVCDCGCTTVVKGNRLRNGKTKSCGCLKTEAQKNLGNNTRNTSSLRMKEYNKTEEHRMQAKEASTTHGGTHTQLFRMWSRMRERCNSTKGCHAKWYHDKGIRVCAEWDNDFAAFREWAYSNGYYEQEQSVSYKDRLSIDRIDPEKGYSPDNCRFITVSENSRLRNKYYADQR